MTAPTAAWTADKLMAKLNAAGHGNTLSSETQGVRTTLTTLVNLLPFKSAEGRVTVRQVAFAAGLSVKWTRRCLQRLEALGIITWFRGYVAEGRPVPSLVRVSKRVLASLIPTAREAKDEHDAQVRRDTRERLSRLHRLTIRPARKPNPRPHHRRNPLSFHGELSTPLPLTGEEPQAFRPHPQPQTPSGDPMPPLNPDGRPCSVCSLSPEGCHDANIKVSPALRHDYDPQPLRTHPVVGRPTPAAPRKAAPTGWRSRTRPSLPAHLPLEDQS